MKAGDAVIAAQLASAAGDALSQRQHFACSLSVALCFSQIVITTVARRYHCHVGTNSVRCMAVQTQPNLVPPWNPRRRRDRDPHTLLMPNIFSPRGGVPANHTPKGQDMYHMLNLTLSQTPRWGDVSHNCHPSYGWLATLVLTPAILPCLYRPRHLHQKTT